MGDREGIRNNEGSLRSSNTFQASSFTFLTFRYEVSFIHVIFRGLVRNV